MQTPLLPDAKIRLDKWLWTVRIFKSRTQATDACKAGKVRLNGTEARPAASCSRGDTVEVRKNGFNFRFEVLELLKNRVSASIAQSCLINKTPSEELEKYNDWFTGKRTGVLRARGTGRPTKKDRRSMDALEDEDELEDDDFPSLLRPS